jgi:hypothetical protein
VFPPPRRFKLRRFIVPGSKEPANLSLFFKSLPFPFNPSFSSSVLDLFGSLFGGGLGGYGMAEFVRKK